MKNRGAGRTLHTPRHPAPRCVSSAATNRAAQRTCCIYIAPAPVGRRLPPPGPRSLLRACFGPVVRAGNRTPGGECGAVEAGARGCRSRRHRTSDLGPAGTGRREGRPGGFLRAHRQWGERGTRGDKVRRGQTLGCLPQAWWPTQVDLMDTSRAAGCGRSLTQAGGELDRGVGPGGADLATATATGLATSAPATFACQCTNVSAESGP